MAPGGFGSFVIIHWFDDLITASYGLKQADENPPSVLH